MPTCGANSVPNRFARSTMPRPNKAIKRQLVSAAEEYKRGNRKEAYDLWGKASAARKERLEKKRNKKAKAAADAG